MADIEWTDADRDAAKAAWNAVADEFNQWDVISLEEAASWILSFARHRIASTKEAVDEIEALRVENERLREHISEQSGHVRTRIKDGDEIGARIWRIALEDVLHENFTTLTQTKDTTDG